MFRHLAFAFVALVLVVGCKGKQKQSDVDSAPLAPGVDGVDSTPMSFDATGSDSGKIEGLVTVFFGYDRSTLDAESRRQIQGNVEWMKRNPGVNLQIEGHCDARGSIEYNIALGERRANAVKSYMVSLGIPAARLSTISYGKDKPMVSGDDDSAYARNRRANFVPLR